MSCKNTLCNSAISSPLCKVKRGDAFLPDVSVSEIESLQTKNTGYKIKYILQAVRLRKEGRTFRDIAKAVGIPKSIVYGWLQRVAVSGFDRIHDSESPGRPCRLSDEQKESLENDLLKHPTECKFLGGSWTAKMVVRHIVNEFKILYSISGALWLTQRLNFSIRSPRPVPYNCATPEKQKEYAENVVKMIKKYDDEHYKFLCLDAAGFVDAPSSSSRGIRRKGGKDAVQINYSKKSFQIIGALGQSTLDIQFHEKVNSEAVIAFLEFLRRKYGKIFVILDNAAAHTSKAVNEYVKNTNGDVVLQFLPPRTPQHNPIEIQWREIRRAVAGIYFGDVDEMQKRIRQLLHSGEVPIVKLFEYMQKAIKNQNGPWGAARPMPVNSATIQQ